MRGQEILKRPRRKAIRPGRAEAAAAEAVRRRATGRASRRSARCAALLFAAFALTSCAGPQSAFTAAGAESESVLNLFWIMLAGSVAIWLFVIGLSLYVIRARASSDRNALLLVVWGGCVFPVVVLTALLVYGLALMPELRSPADGPTIAVSGERFWWRVFYDSPAEPGVTRDLPHQGIESANEIWIPVGRRTEILLGSPDVIHSFWVPAIAGKTDAIPGRINRLVVEPTREGVYNGVCAEFCGEAHAQMAFRILVVSEEEYAARVAAMAEPARVLDHPGLELFVANGCGACHTVRGTEADGRVGPDLTHVAARHTIGAGLLPTTPENIAAFIHSTDHLKPGVEMPSFGMLPDEEIATIAAWLGSLE